MNPMGEFSAGAPSGAYVDRSFFQDFLEGYNTLDALASLAFGIILINALPAEMKGILHTDAILKVGEYLPFFNIGMGWVIPAAVGLVLGMILRKVATKYI